MQILFLLVSFSHLTLPLQKHQKGLFISGCNAFVVNLWGKDSDSVQQALYFVGAAGWVVSYQVSKLFLADRITAEFTNNTLLETNFTSGENLVPSIQTNETVMSSSFESDVENVYFILGSCCMVGMIMHMVCWLHSGCILSHSFKKQKQTPTPSEQSPQHQKRNKLALVVACCLLVCFAFFLFAMDITFGGFGISFAVNILGWRTKDASNLMTLYIAVMMVSCIVTIFLAKYFQAKSLMIVSALCCLAGNIFMASIMKVTQISLWIGACLVGFGFGNALANALNAGNKLTGKASIISSVVNAGAYSGNIVGPQVIGYLLDHEDPMWFLYICVVYSSVMLVFSLVFWFVLPCCGKVGNAEQQDCAVPPKNMKTETTHM